MSIKRSQTTTTTSNFPTAAPVLQLSADRDFPAFARRRSFAPDLAETPDVRAEVVARGRALVANPNYPSTAQLKSVATVIAGNEFHRQRKP